MQVLFRISQQVFSENLKLFVKCKLKLRIPKGPVFLYKIEPTSPLFAGTLLQCSGILAHFQHSSPNMEGDSVLESKGYIAAQALQCRETPEQPSKA